MAKFTSFEEIEAWQKARVLTRSICRISGRGEFARDFGLLDRIRRASVSIVANLAEGFERGGNKEFVQFLATAKGSGGEVRSLPYVALDAEFIGKKIFDDLCSTSAEINRMLGGLMKYPANFELRGTKFQRSIRKQL